MTTENRYKKMLDMAIELARLQNIREALNLIVRCAIELLECDRCTLYLVTASGNQLVSEFLGGEQIKEIKIPLDSLSIAGYCGVEKKIVNIPDVYDNISKRYKNIKFNPYFDRINKYRTKSILAVPLLNDTGQLLGIIEAINKLNDSEFDKEDEQILELLAKQAAITVSRLQQQEMATFFGKDEQQYMRGPKELFVVYFDITNYTGLSETLGDSKMKQIIQLWENDHIHLINMFGGIYVKSVGDEIMSVFGLTAKPYNYDNSYFKQKNINNNLSAQLDYFLLEKQKISNLGNLDNLIKNFRGWYNANEKKLTSKLKIKAKSYINMFYAENVIRFMYAAQKKLDWLNKEFIKYDLIGNKIKDRIFMKGGAEFGSAIVDFDIYGRIDVIGDIVNIASRITSEGSRLTIISATDDHPILIGQNFYNALLNKEFINVSKNIAKLKGKEKKQYFYVVDSISMLENKLGLNDTVFKNHKAYIEKQTAYLDKIKQGFLPFNFASYKLEIKDKYKNDHSKRVAIWCLHIIDLINKNLTDKIKYEEERIAYYKTLIKKIKMSIDAISKKIEDPEIDVAEIITGKKFSALDLFRQIDFLFEIKQLDNWRKKNEKKLSVDTMLNENFLQEYNLFKSIESNGDQKNLKTILTEALYRKMDILKDSENNIDYKKNLIEQYKNQTITEKIKKDTIIAALLHDLGSKSLSDDIKAYDEPTRSITDLSAEEREEYSALTSSFGASVIASIDELADISNIIRWSQSHFNGIYKHKKLNSNTEIPKFENIPIESRILCIANAMDAILSDKPTRERFGIPDMCKLLYDDLASSLENDRKKFDPFILSLILNYFDYTFSKDIITGAAANSRI